MRVHEGQIATAIPIPSNSPTKVKAAQERFRAVAEKFSKAQSIIDRAEARLAQARAEDTARVAQQLLEGQEPTNLREAEEAIEAEVGEAQRMADALKLALDQAGDQLAEAITAEQDKWKAKCEADAEKALARYHDALATMQAALDTYDEAMSVAAWLTPEPIESAIGHTSKATRGWTGAKLLIGPQGDQVWHGNRGVLVRVDQAFKLDNPTDVRKLVPILRNVGQDINSQPRFVKPVNHRAAPKVPGVGEAITSKEKIRG